MASGKPLGGPKGPPRGPQEAQDGLWDPQKHCDSTPLKRLVCSRVPSRQHCDLCLNKPWARAPETGSPRCSPENTWPRPAQQQFAYDRVGCSLLVGEIYGVRRCVASTCCALVIIGRCGCYLYCLLPTTTCKQHLRFVVGGNLLSIKIE